MATNLSEDPILRRAFLFLEEGDWDSAYEYADKALDASPENYRAYLCKLLCEVGIKKEDMLGYASVDFSVSVNYKNAVKFADGKQHEYLKISLESAKKNEAARLAAKEKSDEKKAKIAQLETEIQKAENDISYYYNKIDDIKESKKDKIIAGIYLPCFVLPIVGLVGVIIWNSWASWVALACLLLGIVCIIVLHSIMAYRDELFDSGFANIGSGLLNLWTLGIWGLIRSIKKLAYKPSSLKIEELRNLISLKRKKVEDCEKEIAQIKAN